MCHDTIDSLVISFLGGIQIETNPTTRGKSTTNKGTNATKGDSRNNVHPVPNLPSNHQTTTNHNKTFDTPNRVKFLKHILVGDVWSFLQILKNPLPFWSTIFKERAPHRLVCFLHLPMQSVKIKKKKKKNPPPLDNPRETTFTKFGQRISAAYKEVDKEALKIISKNKGYLLGKELPHDISRIVPHLLSQWATIELVLYWLHILWATMRASLINLRWDPIMPLIHCHRFMDN